MEIGTIISIIIIGIFILGVIGFIAWQIKEKGLRNFAIELIVKAEEEFNDGENDAKFEYVVNGLKAVIPAPFNLFITVNMIENLVQNVFDVVKAALDYSPSSTEEVK